MISQKNRGLSPDQPTGDCLRKEKVIIKAQIEPLLRSVEAIVFDIDGVLIDVSGSFRKTIAETVQYYFERILKYDGVELLVTQEEIQLFKEVGGFNNDWELTECLVLFYLCKASLFSSKDLAVLRFQEPYLSNFVVKNVRNFEKAALGLLGNREKKAVLGLYNKSLIRQIFQEMYSGDEYCELFYGFKPAYFKGEGTIKNEKALPDLNLINKPAAVVTGRTEIEAKAALDFIGLDISSELIVSDNGKFKRKPDIAPLNYLSDKMNVNLGIYIGDTMDDFQMVKNFNQKYKNKRYLSAMITNEKENFKDADIVAQNVNEILRIIRGWENNPGNV